jgi:hypothetical protein
MTSSRSFGGVGLVVESGEALLPRGVEGRAVADHHHEVTAKIPVVKGRAEVLGGG